MEAQKVESNPTFLISRAKTPGDLDIKYKENKKKALISAKMFKYVQGEKAVSKQNSQLCKIEP